MESQQDSPPSTQENILSTSQPKSTTTKKRGPTVMKEVLVDRSTGKKQKVDWNVDGRPIGEGGRKLTGFIGTLARERIPITKCKHEISAELKLELWAELLKTFELEQCRKHFVFKKFWLAARQFRSRLSTRFMFDKKGRVITTPPEQYNIDPEEWVEFVNTRASEEFQEKSRKQKERASNSIFPHKKSRKSFAALAEEEKERRISRGEECEDVPRHILCLEARKNKEGQIDNPNVLAVAEKINALSQTQPSLVTQTRRRDDMLAQVIEKPKVGCRVRGVGFGMTNTQYFGNKTSSEDTTIAQLRSDMQMLKQTMEQLVQEMTTTAAPPRDVEDVVSSNDSSPSLRLPEGIFHCSLSIGGNKIVARGKVYNRPDARVVHGKELDEFFVKVSVELVIDREAILPITDVENNIEKVKDVQGSFVAWPTHLVFIETPVVDGPSTGKQVGSQETPIVAVGKSTATNP